MLYARCVGFAEDVAYPLKTPLFSSDKVTSRKSKKLWTKGPEWINALQCNLLIKFYFGIKNIVFKFLKLKIYYMFNNEFYKIIFYYKIITILVLYWKC